MYVQRRHGRAESQAARRGDRCLRDVSLLLRNVVADQEGDGPLLRQQRNPRGAPKEGDTHDGLRRKGDAFIQKSTTRVSQKRLACAVDGEVCPREKFSFDILHFILLCTIVPT